jgi:hypothetical protein
MIALQSTSNHTWQIALKASLLITLLSGKYILQKLFATRHTIIDFF